jgi:5-methylthioadenosine/S-adenosylhomocysteine deaminase
LRRAGLVLLRTDALNVMPINDLAGAVVLGVDTSNVDTVIVTGRLAKRGGRMIVVNLHGVQQAVYDARDRAFAKAGIGVKGMRPARAAPAGASPAC